MAATRAKPTRTQPQVPQLLCKCAQAHARQELVYPVGIVIPAESAQLLGGSCHVNLHAPQWQAFPALYRHRLSPGHILLRPHTHQQ